MAIQTFKCKESAELFQTGNSVKFNSIKDAAMIRLGFLDAAVDLGDLKNPKSNNLHPMNKEKKRLDNMQSASIPSTEFALNGGRKVQKKSK